jgi:hypothetical protein
MMATIDNKGNWGEARVGGFGGLPNLVQNAAGRWIEVAPGSATNAAVYGGGGCKAALGTEVPPTKWRRVKLVVREKTASEKMGDAAAIMVRALGLAAVALAAYAAVK